MTLFRPSLLPRLLLPIALLLAVSACSTFPTLKSHDNPPPRKTEEAPPAPKKVEEPPPRKVEPEKPQPPALRVAEQELAWGIRKYEEGEYKIAARNLQNALGSGLVSVGDRVTAHKYLAFIYCGSAEKLACRGEFKEILKLNPKFELTPAEAGHPIWGPVFREVKSEMPGQRTKKKRRK